MPHTPGPWLDVFYPAEPGRDVGKAFVWIHRDATDATCADPKICELFAMGDDGRAGGEMQANARLIAAAPELLKACHIALTFVQDGELPVDSPKSVASILHAAIAKAKGE